MHLGFYEDAGIKVSMLIPDENWSRDPFTKAIESDTHFVTAPSESLVSYMVKNWSSAENKRFKAVAALLQSDPSAIVTLQNRGMDDIKNLDGKVYASYGAQFEGRIVQQLVRNNGGTGVFFDCQTPMNSTLESLIAGKADAAWVFRNIEGVVASLKGIPLNFFHLSTHGIPYGYTPILSASERFLREEPETVRAFLFATAKGYSWMASYPAASAVMLHAPPQHACSPQMVAEHYRAASVVQASVAATAPLVVLDGQWGTMSTTRWSQYLNWLGNHGLLPAETVAWSSQDRCRGRLWRIIREDPSFLFTNEFLPTHQAILASFQRLC